MVLLRDYPFSGNFSNDIQRFFLGVDQIFEVVDNVVKRQQTDDGYPPYNVRKIGDDKYRVELALAGFSKSDISVELERTPNRVLRVSGKRDLTEKNEVKSEFIFKGIAGRSFKRDFPLTHDLEVESVQMKNGVLTIDLIREIPEDKKTLTFEVK